MSRFVLHPAALADLDEIWEFIAADSLDAADRVLQEIHAAILSAVSFPRAGHVRTEVTSRPLRFHVVRDFLVAYSPEEDPVVVVAIIHGRRNPRVIAAMLRERK